MDEEAASLRPLPAVAYEVEQFHEGIVRKDGHIRFRNKYYSVDEEHIGRSVVVLGSLKLVAIYLGGKLLEVHDRITDPNQSKSTKPHHLKPWERTMEDGSVYRQRAAGSHVKKLVLRLLQLGRGFIDTRKIGGFAVARVDGFEIFLFGLLTHAVTLSSVPNSSTTCGLLSKWVNDISLGYILDESMRDLDKEDG